MIIDRNTVIKPQVNLVTRKLSYFVLGLIIFLFVLVGFSKVNAVAGIYSVINFQGKLVNKADGTNITDGNYNFTFKLYDAASGGNLLPSGTGWSETQNLAVTSGIFRAGLGSSTAFPTTLDFNSDSIYLDVSFNGENFSTRVRLTAVPYAFNAQKVGGLTVTNTTGTLTVTGGSTVAFGGNFTTSGSNAVTLSSTGTTGLTLPTSGTLTTGTGIANYLSRWSSTGNLSTGISYDNGTSVGIGYTNVNSAGQFVVSGNIGIGLTNPTNKLDVIGAVSIGFNGNTAAPSNGLMVQGNAGIGSTGFTGATLDVAGTLRIGTTNAAANSQTLCLGTNNIVSACTAGGTFTGTGLSNYLVRWSSATNLSTGISYDNGTSVGIGYTNVNSAGMLVVSGNIGIGLTNPTNKLDVLGAVSIGFNGNTAAPSNGLMVQGNAGIGSTGRTGATLDVAGTLRVGTTNAAVNSQTLCVGTDNILSACTGGGGTFTGTGATNYLTRWTSSTNLSTGISYDNGSFVGIGYTAAAGTPSLIVNGNVGIGTTNPSAYLELSGSVAMLRLSDPGNSSNTLDISNTGNLASISYGTSILLESPDSGDYLNISGPGTAPVNIYTNSLPRFTIKGDGKIGFGTTNPAFQLDVIGSGRFTTGLYLGIDNTTDGLLTLYSSGNGITDSTISTNASGDLILKSPNGSLVLGTGPGSVSISLVSQNDILDVKKTTSISSAYSLSDFVFTRNLTLGNTAAGGAVVKIIDQSNGSGTINPDMLLINAAPASGTFTGNLLRLQSAGLDKLIVNSAGSVGIGYTNLSASQALAVNGNVAIGVTSNSARLTVRGAGTTTGFGIHVEDNNGTDRFVILDNGNVGIGTTSPDGRLQLNGTTTVGATAVSYGLKITAGLNGTMGTTFPQTAYYSFYNVPVIGVTAAAGTAPQLRNLFVTYLGASVATGQTVTNSYSLFIAGLNGNAASVVNNYAFVTNTGSGNVGIGTSVPNGLFVVGLGTSQSIYADVAGNVSIGSTAPGINYSVNIGIGSSSPTINIGTGNTGSHVLFADITGVAAAAAGSAAWSNGEFHFGTSAAVTAGGRIWIKSGNSVYTFRSAARGALADYSEYMKQEVPSESEPGDIMTMSQSGTGKVTRSSIQYDPNVAGAVTTGERGTSNNDLEFDNFSESGSRQDTPEWANVGMLGQVYVKVNLENGKVNAGDAVTTSSQAGIGMKATEQGRIVGWAVQPWDGSQTRDERAPQQSLPTGVGMILVYVNPTLYTPKMDKPDLLVFDPQGIVNSFMFDLPIVGYRIRDSVGNIIKTTSSFAESAIGNLRAGGIQAKQIVTESLKTKEAEVDLAKINFVEAQTVTTDLLKTKGLIITGDDGLDKIVFDNKGNAFFAGTVTADTIKAKHIDGLEIIQEKLATLEGQIAGISTNSTDVNTASISGILNDTAKRVDSLEKKLNDLEKISYQPTASQTAFLQVASSSANLSNLGSTIPAVFDSAIISNNLTVLGKTNLNSLGVTGDINAGVLVMNGLDLNGGANIYTLSGALKIQASALGDIELMNDLVHLDTKGNVRLKEGDIVLEKGKIQGNDSFTGSATVPHGKTKVVITKAWDESPASIIATPTYNTRTWVSDISKSGFTINVDSSNNLDQPIYWVAFFGVVPTPTPLTTSKTL